MEEIEEVEGEAREVGTPSVTLQKYIFFFSFLFF